jgi:hypothetical protein
MRAEKQNRRAAAGAIFLTTTCHLLTDIKLSKRKLPRRIVFCFHRLEIQACHETSV